MDFRRRPEGIIESLAPTTTNSEDKDGETEVTQTQTQTFVAAAAQLAEDKQEAQELLKSLTETPEYQRKLHAWRQTEARIQHEEANLEDLWEQLLQSPTTSHPHTQQLLQQLLQQQQQQHQQQQQQPSSVISPLSSPFSSPSNQSRKSLPVTLEEEEGDDDILSYTYPSNTDYEPTESSYASSAWSEFGSNPNTPAKVVVPVHVPASVVANANHSKPPPHEEPQPNGVRPRRLLLSPSNEARPFETDVDDGGSWGDPNQHRHTMRMTVVPPPSSSSSDDDDDDLEESDDELELQRLAAELPYPLAPTNSNKYFKDYDEEMVQLAQQILHQDQIITSMDHNNHNNTERSDTDDDDTHTNTSPMDHILMERSDMDGHDGTIPHENEEDEPNVVMAIMSTPLRHEAVQVDAAEEVARQMAHAAASWNNTNNNTDTSTTSSTASSPAGTSVSSSSVYFTPLRQEQAVQVDAAEEVEGSSRPMVPANNTNTNTASSTSSSPASLSDVEEDVEEDDTPVVIVASTPLRQNAAQVDAAVEVSRQMAQAAASWNNTNNNGTSTDTDTDTASSTASSSSASPVKSSVSSSSSYLIPSPPKQRRVVHSSMPSYQQQQQQQQQQPSSPSSLACPSDDTVWINNLTPRQDASFLVSPSDDTVWMNNLTPRQADASDASRSKPTSVPKEPQSSISSAALQETARVDVAVEATRQMAQALKDTTSVTPVSRRNNDSTTTSKKKKSKVHPPPPLAPDKDEERIPIKDVRLTPKRPLQRTIPHLSPLVTSPGSTCSGNTENMLRSLAVGKEAPTVEYEPICSAEEEDDDYVPLADYTSIKTATTNMPRMDLPDDDSKRQLQRTIPHQDDTLRPVGNTLYQPICSAQEEDDDYVPLGDYTSMNTTTTHRMDHLPEDDWETYRDDAPITHRATAFAALQQRLKCHRRRRRRIVFFGGLFLILAAISVAMMYHGNSSNETIVGGPSIDNDRPTSLVGTPSTTVTISPTTNMSITSINHRHEEKDIGKIESRDNQTVVVHPVSTHTTSQGTTQGIVESNFTLILQKDNKYSLSTRRRLRRCSIPFAYLASRRCRIMLKEQPLFNVQALTDCMLE
eukprot:scaffold54494_cov54-Attheya_sp.AAC.1